jgi:hypothetical protein
MQSTGSINRDDDIKGLVVPNKKVDSFGFGNEVPQNDLLHSLIRENNKINGGYEESDHEDYRNYPLG